MTTTLDRPLHLATPDTGTHAPDRGDSTPDPRGPGFRADLQGLRAVAVLAVVLFHADVPGLAGGYVGVDVFFVLSGFLITGQLVREARATGRIDLLRFWSGRVRRLLPAAALVLAATVVVARLVLPPQAVGPLVRDALLAAVHGLNYSLAADGVDYQQAGAAVSPLQHYWSLNVEEQFYLAWPLLVGACALLARRRVAALLAVVLVAVVAASAWTSATLTATNEPLGYFSAQSRVWELGAGGLLALTVPLVRRLPPLAAALLSWAGLSAIVVSVLLFDDQTAFPGTAAWLPVLGTAAVLLAGCGERAHPRSGTVALAWRPAQWVGAASYAWYLWHWPFLVLAPYALGEQLGWPRQLVVAGLSLWAAALTHLVLSRPITSRPLRPWRWVGRGVTATAAVAGVAVLVQLSVPTVLGRTTAPVLLAAAAPADAGFDRSLRAAVSRAVTTDDVPVNLTPTLLAAVRDVPASGGCHAGVLQVGQGDCVFGDPDGARTVVLFGDSHAEQWLPALDLAGQRAGWRIVSWTKAACPAADVTPVNPQLGRSYTECDRWRERTLERIRDLAPDRVVVGQSDALLLRGQPEDVWVRQSLRTVVELGDLPVTWLADTPHPTGAVPECLATHLGTATACAFGDVDEPVRERGLAVAAAMAAEGLDGIDLRTWMCVDGTCPALIGDHLVYRDASHLTATFARYLTPLWQRELAAWGSDSRPATP